MIFQSYVIKNWDQNKSQNSGMTFLVSLNIFCTISMYQLKKIYESMHLNNDSTLDEHCQRLVSACPGVLRLHCNGVLTKLVRLQCYGTHYSVGFRLLPIQTTACSYRTTNFYNLQQSSTALAYVYLQHHVNVSVNV